MGKGLLIDVTKCIGCRGCQVACKQWHNLVGEETSFSPTWTNPPDLTAKTWTHVNFRAQHNGDRVVWRFVKTQCMHCLDPACVSACPVGALYKTQEGPVDYRGERCIGCRYCMIACPFQVPKFEWDKALPLIKKCNMCVDRVLAGKKTACSTACPTGAITYGDRDFLLEEAERRIRSRPDRYINYIYGKDEVGGTSVMYLSDIPFEALGFRTDLVKEPLPMFTWQAMSKIPGVVIGMGLLLSALYFYTKRRAEVHDKERGIGA